VTATEITLAVVCSSALASTTRSHDDVRTEEYT